MHYDPSLSPCPAPRLAVITEALRWEGTPFHRGQLVRGLAGDCCAMLYTVYQQLTGTVPWVPYVRPPPPYDVLFSGQWEVHTQQELLVEGLRRYMPALQEIRPAEAQPGDVLLTGRPGEPANHVAILLAPALVLHARVDPLRRPYGARLLRERRHDALRRTERTAFSFVWEEEQA